MDSTQNKLEKTKKAGEKKEPKYSFYKIGKIVLGNMDEVIIMDLEYKSNHAPNLSAKIDKDGLHIKVAFSNLRYVKDAELMRGIKLKSNDDKFFDQKIDASLSGMRVFNQNDDNEAFYILIQWKKRNIQFNYMDGRRAGDLIYEDKDLIEKDDLITDVLLNLKLRYFLTGT